MSESHEQLTSQTDEDVRKAAQKRRNFWLALALFAFVVIVGVTTMIRLGDSDLGPDGGLYWSNPPETREQAPMPTLPESPQEDPQ